MERKELLQGIKRIHFVGIGGSGMSPLAEILHSRGYTVTGSDINESDNVDRMRKLGITVSLTQHEHNIGDAQLIVYTSAVNPQNPELEYAKNNHLPLIERGQLLGLITREFPDTVCIAGTHGKTTTTSMLSQILLMAEFDPTVFIGGRLPLINANGRAGKSRIMVCEACEFQDHYLEMRPAISVILNIDADHLDYFGTLDNVIASFRKFSNLSKKIVLVNADDKNSVSAVEGLNKKIVTFGTTENCDWHAENITFRNGSYGQYDLYNKDKFFSAISLGVPGMHNVLNSVAAAAAANWCGANAEQIAKGLQAFNGAGRRFEFLGTFNDVTVADDYAHHPTEIAATLSTAKGLGYESVWAVFQPFTFSRTARHFDGFVQSLSVADKVIISDIMGSREQNTYDVSSEQIANRIPGACYIPTFDEIADYVSKNAVSGELVLTMGGGDVYKCARKIAKKLEDISAR